MVATRSKTAPPGPERPRPHFAAHPSEEELIASFLRPRVASGDRSCAFAHDADVYSATPAELTSQFAPAVAGNGDRAWYFFSAVRAKSREGQRKARTVDTGEGCWHSEAGAKPVLEGHRQSFSFVTKAGGRRVRSGWLMVELGLDGADDMVLCKIYFSPRARTDESAAAAMLAGCKRKAATAADRNPAAPARQRGRPGRAEAAASSSAAEDGVTTAAAAEEGDQAQADWHSIRAAGDLDAVPEDWTFTRDMIRIDQEMAAMGFVYVPRSDAEVQEEYGIANWLRLLLGEDGKGITLEPPWQPRSPTAGDRGYPACISREELAARTHHPRWNWLFGPSR